MQTTLLGLAIGLILALLAALVGPHFVNWNDHRAFFEGEASRIVGVRVTVGGDIDAGILPFPTVVLNDIAIGPAGETSRMRATSLRIELGLGPLMRGELRATDMKLVAPQFAIGLDRSGQIDWPALALASESLSIDRLSVENGRVTVADAVSRSEATLDQFWFTGEVRSLTGPIRGKGEFVSGGALYGYEVSAGRSGPDGMRLRLAVKTDERPMTVEADGMLAFDRASPRFDGTLTLSRPAGAVLASGKAVAIEPWRLTSKVKADTGSAALDEVSFQYGPDERAVSLTGAGKFNFGAYPHMQGSLSARQIDLDKLIATTGMQRRLPFSAVQSFGELVGSALRPSWPVTLALNADGMTVGGGAVQAVSTELRSDGATWTVDKLEFRAPGFTHVKVDGRLFPLGKGLGFVGGAAVDSSDPRNLVAWLGGSAPAAVQVKPWHAIGDVTLGADRIAIERLQTQLDRGAVEGSLSYIWPADGRPASLEADIKAAEIDLDGMWALGEQSLAGLGIEKPQAMKLAIEVGRAKFAGLDARNIAARFTADGEGLAIERLSVGDFGDANFVATGRIRTASPPGGSLTVFLDARDLNGGVLALTEKFAPAFAGSLRTLAARQKTATLRAAIGLSGSGSDATTGKLELGGQLGAVKVSLTASASGKHEAFSVTDLGALAGAGVQIGGQFESPDSAPLLALLGLDRIAGAQPRAGKLAFSANGASGRDLRFEAKLDAGLVDAGGNGTIKIVPGRPAAVSLERFAGTVGASKVQGKLALTLGDDARLDGSVEADAIEAPAAVAAAVGMPAVRTADGSGWSAEPFVWKAPGVNGRVEFKAQRATLLPGVAAEALRGVVRFGAAEVVFEDLSGELAKGRAEGRLAISNGDGGVSARVRVAVNGADPGVLLQGERPAMTGSLAAQAELEGAGRSAAAFMGSLTGFGSLKLDRAQWQGLNAEVFGAVLRAGDVGVSLEGPRLREFVFGMLDIAPLQVTRAQANVGIKDGRARLNDISIQAVGADVQGSASMDLLDASVDARLTVSGPQATGTVRPSLSVAIKGPVLAAKRTVDIGPLVTWMTLRSAEQQSRRIDALEQAAREAPPVQKPAEPQAAPIRPPAAPMSVVPAAPGGSAAPALPPPVSVPQPSGPRAGAPRAEGTVMPLPSPRPPALIGAQN